MGEPLTIVVALRVDAASVEAFETYERAAARAMTRHGGRIERAVRGAASEGDWFEVHLVSFPDDASFERYRDDPETAALAADRDAAIRATWMFAGREHTGYGPDGNEVPDASGGDAADVVARALSGGPAPTPSERWRASAERLETTFTLPDFAAAIDFMARCTPVIEALDHHPDWSNAHRRVHVVLTTHSAGNTVTDLDRRLAAAMDELYVETASRTRPRIET